jgi:competence protein ComFC
MLDLLLPRRCVVCGTSRTLLCEDCLLGLPRLTPPLCGLCGAPTAWPVARCSECAGRRLAFKRARSATQYDAVVRCLVRSWKERGLRSLGAAAALVIVERLPVPDADVVTFVPPDRGRRLERGYHPAEQLARAVAASWGLPCECLLTRAGGTRQRGLSRGERRRNVAHAFSGDAAGRRVVLVDDVYTTGATVHAAAKVLRTEVEVVTFARAARSS